MARRVDSGYRDPMLGVRHAHWGVPFPVTSMDFPVLEYDHGDPVAVLDYQQRGKTVSGPDTMAAYRAFGRLGALSGVFSNQLPFITVQYDHRNWSYRLFGHNDAGRQFLGGPGWLPMSEAGFVDHLYRLRGRMVPDLAPYGVRFATESWDDAALPGFVRTTRVMSERRRDFEPVQQVRASWRVPCTDVDLAVVDRNDHVSLVVDYKAAGGPINLKSTNLAALAKLRSLSGDGHFSTSVPAMVVAYTQQEPRWRMRVHCLNQAAWDRLARVLGAPGVTPPDWVDLSEDQWRGVLDAARSWLW